MAWLDSNWLYRVPLTYANHSGVDTPEGQFTVNKSLGKFWDNTLSTFNDVRITQADGTTLLDWAFHGGTPSQANRTATIQIDNHPSLASAYGNAAASASVGAWMYFGNSTNNLASGANNSINITTTPKTVLIDPSDPNTSSTCFNIGVGPITVNQTYPRAEMRKSSATQTRIFWDLSSAVLGLRRSNQNSTRNEEIAYVTAIIYDQDGANTTSAMTDLNAITIMDNYVVQMPIKAGDHEKRYMIIITFGLIDEAGNVRVIDQRATLHVQNTVIHPSIVVS